MIKTERANVEWLFCEKCFPFCFCSLFMVFVWLLWYTEIV